MYGIRKCSNFILLHVVVQLLQHHLLKRLFPHCIFLSPLSKIRCSHVHGFISGLSSLVHWAILLFFFLKIALAIWGLLYFHMNFEIFCSSSVTNAIGKLIGIALNL